MDELNNTVTQQMQQLQTLMHRMAFHGFTAQGRAKHNPYRGQGRVLSVLHMKPEISQKELTGLLDMSKQSIAELLGKMEKSGYIERKPSETDKRSISIRLLPEGEKAAREMEQSPMEVVRIFDCLEPEELERFSGCLERIIHRCVEYFPGDDFEERRHKMECFLANCDHSFTHFEEYDKSARRKHHPHKCGDE